MKFFQTCSVASVSFCSSYANTAAAADPASYRTGKAERRIAGVPAAIRQAIFTQPDGRLEPLVHWLVRDVKDDFLKVKILHDWIADNIDYDVESFFAGGPPESSWQATLTRRKAVCQGYAELLQKMCRVAGIPVRGDCRLWPRVRLPHRRRRKTSGKTNHAWNAVKIQKKWYLVDVCWDAGHVEGKSYHKQYGTSYLFAAAAGFPAHPLSDARQNGSCSIRPCPPSSSPPCRCLQGGSSRAACGWRRPCGVCKPVGESVQFSIAAPEDVLLMAGLVEPGKTGRPDFEGRTLVRRGRNEVNVLVTFPAAGRWGVETLHEIAAGPGPVLAGGHAGVRGQGRHALDLRRDL